MGRQEVINGCWEDDNRMGWRGKELGDMEMERSDEGDRRQDGNEGNRMMKGRRLEDGQGMEDGGWSDGGCR